ncbi:family 43 glycosylhydrolase [Deinococcus navajonensis]|uniref:Family 43 glycosylhydrolase n=1 Tax=Deinococcus navajonensis TaxID=309884 RepID=A0ABV8XQJ1_9DEIO
MPSPLNAAVLAVLGLATLTTASQVLTRPAKAQTFRNPILPAGQDPSVVFDAGFYHLVQSDEDGISVRTSLTLTGLGNAKKTVVWRGGQDDSPCCELWAPELVRWGDRWYIYYAADDGRNENHRMYVLESRRPGGPYTFKGKISDPTNRWAIDGTVFQAPDGQRYYLWSGWEGTTNVQQNLYISRMRNPWTLQGERVLISSPEQPWELNGSPYINEGPEVLMRGGRVFVVYSASGSWTNDYCLGWLSLQGSVLDPKAWRKSNGCVFSRNDEASVFAPGHNTFVKSPDGSEDWQLFHANEIAGSSWGGRSVRAQKVSWNPDGTPRFGRPTAFSAALPLPSGEYEAEQARLVGVEVRETSLASGGQAARLDSRTDRLELRVRAPKAGAYTLRVRFANGSGRAARQTISVNGAATKVSYASGGWENFGSRPLAVRLRTGENEVKFAQDTGAVQIDAVTLTPADTASR